MICMLYVIWFDFYCHTKMSYAIDNSKFYNVRHGNFNSLIDSNVQEHKKIAKYLLHLIRLQISLDVKINCNHFSTGKQF